jgi:hypothetical protein
VNEAEALAEAWILAPASMACDGVREGPPTKTAAKANVALAIESMIELDV